MKKTGKLEDITIGADPNSKEWEMVVTAFWHDEWVGNFTLKQKFQGSLVFRNTGMLKSNI
jgi:hypothetical protein